MGMYTLLKFDSTLRADTPARVIETLRRMLNPECPRKTDVWPDHPLFHTERYWVMLKMSSAYFDEPTQSTLRKNDDGSWRLEVQCNFKNYDDEIRLFTDWIMPYTTESDGTELGYHRYEEYDENTPIVKCSVTHQRDEQ